MTASLQANQIKQSSALNRKTAPAQSSKSTLPMVASLQVNQIREFLMHAQELYQLRVSSE